MSLLLKGQLSAVETKIDTIDSEVGTIDGIVDTINTNTAALRGATGLTAARAGYLDNLNTYLDAAVSGVGLKSVQVFSDSMVYNDVQNDHTLSPAIDTAKTFPIVTSYSGTRDRDSNVKVTFTSTTNMRVEAAAGTIGTAFTITYTIYVVEFN